MTLSISKAVSRYGSDVDLFSQQSLMDPYEDYRTLRDAGPIAYLKRYTTWIVTRYDEVRRILRDSQTFSSAQGVGLNPIINDGGQESVVTTDRPVHTPMSKVFDEVLRPGVIGEHLSLIERYANRFVEMMCEQR